MCAQLICVSGFEKSTNEAAKVADAIEQFVRLKTALNAEHKVAVSCFTGSVMGTITRDVREGACAEWKNLLQIELPVHFPREKQDFCSLIRAADPYLNANRVNEYRFSRLIIVHRNGEREVLVPPDPSSYGPARCHVDCLFLYSQADPRHPQSEFDKISLLGQFHHKFPPYTIDVCGTDEQLAEAFAMILGHPAHRSDQVRAQGLLRQDGHE